MTDNRALCQLENVGRLVRICPPLLYKRKRGEKGAAPADEYDRTVRRHAQLLDEGFGRFTRRALGKFLVELGDDGGNDVVR